jgi:hypothetical protein
VVGIRFEPEDSSLVSASVSKYCRLLYAND